MEYIVLGFGEFPRHVQAGQPIRSTDDNDHEGCHLVSIKGVDDVSGGSTNGLDVETDSGYGVWVIMISADPPHPFGVRTPPGLAVPTLC